MPRLLIITIISLARPEALISERINSNRLTAVAGENGHANTFNAAVALARGFALPEDQAPTANGRKGTPGLCASQY